MKWNTKIVLVTGANGFMGTQVVKELKKRNPKEIICPSSKDCDLREKENCKAIVKDVDLIFHLAGKGGGIGIMKEKPAEIFYDNIMMGTNLIHEAKEANVEKFIGIGTVCSYPKFAKIPFTEELIWDGYPEETNAAYGLAKKMMIVQSEAYKKQYNFNSISIIPTNLYGPGDDFNPITSHVIPALILKIFNAKNSNSITLWGDGSPTRDFLYIDDVAKGIVLAAENYNDHLPVNLGSDDEISIKDLANLISKLMQFEGKIKWDKSKPNGQPRRRVSNKRAKESFRFKPETNIEDGLRNTIEWFYSQNKRD
jgi:GDP-L-fucose synthase